MTEALVAHGPLRGVDPDAVPKSHQQKLNELLSGLLRDVDTDVRQVNSVDWQPKGVSLPENVGPVKVDSLAPRTGSGPAAEGRDVGAGTEPGQSVRPGAEPEPARVDSGGGVGPRPAGELHARLLQRLAGEELAGESSAVAPGEPAASKGAIVNELPGGRGALAEGSVAKPEKPTGVVAGEVNTSGGRDVRAGSLQPEAADRPMPAGGDDAGVVAGRSEGTPENPVTSGKPEADSVRLAAVGDEEVVAVGRSAESPEATATPRRPAVDGAVVREPAAGAMKASESPAPVRNAPEATPAKASGETKPPVNRADAVDKPLGYPDRAVSADASKPPVVKPEARGGDITGDTTVKPSAETPAKSSVSAEEPGRAAEDGSPPRFDAESADDSGAGTGERYSGSGDGHDGPAADAGSEGVDLAARYLREAHEVLARHAATDWSLVSPEGFDWMIRQSKDGHESAAAMVEIIRRGDPKHRVLRWTQVMAVLVARDGGVGNMQAGEGKTLVFLAAAALKSAQGGPVKVITTRDVLANEAFAEYNAILGEYGFDIVRMNPDNPYVDPVEGRPTIYIGTMNDAGFGELRGNVAPARRNGIDEIDEALVFADTTFVLSEGSGNPAAVEVEAAVGDAHAFFTDARKAGLLTEFDFGREPGRVGGGTELSEAGRAKVEEILGRPLTEEETNRLTMAAAAEFEYVENDHYVVWHHPELGPEYVVGADGARVVNPESHKIYIIDQTSHKVMFDAETSTESRWNGGLAQAVEAKHGIRIRDDPASSASITAGEMFSADKSDEMFGFSGTADTVAGELSSRYGAQVVDIPRFKELQLKIADDHVAVGREGVISHQDAKLTAMASSIAERQPSGIPQLAVCNRNSEVARLSALLDRAGVEHIAVDAKFFLRHGVDAEAKLQEIFAEAGQRGKVLVINRQGGRGVDIPVGADVDAAGGLHVLISGRSAESRAVDIQVENRTARSGGNGSAQYFTAVDDALYADAPEAQISIIRYAQHQDALAEHRAALADHASAPSRETQERLAQTLNKVEVTDRNLAAANADIRALAEKLQPVGVRQSGTHDPATAHLPNAPPATDTSLTGLHRPEVPKPPPPAAGTVGDEPALGAAEPTRASTTAVPAAAIPQQDSSSATSAESPQAAVPGVAEGAVAADSSGPGTEASPETLDVPRELRAAQQGDPLAARSLVQTLWPAALAQSSTQLGWDTTSGAPLEPVRQLAHAMTFAGFRAAALNGWSVPSGQGLGEWLRDTTGDALLDGLGRLDTTRRGLVASLLQAPPHEQQPSTEQLDALEQLTRAVHAQYRAEGAPETGVPTGESPTQTTADSTEPAAVAASPVGTTGIAPAESAPVANSPAVAGRSGDDRPDDIPASPVTVAAAVDPAAPTSRDPGAHWDLRVLQRGVVAAYRSLEGLTDADPVVAALAASPVELFGQFVDQLYPSQRRVLELRFRTGLNEEQTAYGLNARSTPEQHLTATTVGTLAAGGLRRLARSIAGAHGVPGVEPAIGNIELAVLDAAAQGLSRAAIAQRSNMPRRTVAAIDRQAARTLGVANRAAAVAEATRRGELDPAAFPLPENPATIRLSERETAVLALTAKGRTPAAIAAILSLQTAAVHTHLREIGRVLGTYIPAAMVAVGIRAGILQVDGTRWSKWDRAAGESTADGVDSGPRAVVTTDGASGRAAPVDPAALGRTTGDDSTLTRARAGDETARLALNTRYGRENIQRTVAMLGWEPGRGTPPVQLTRLAHAIHFRVMAFAADNRWPVPAGRGIADWLFEVAQNTLFECLDQVKVHDRRLIGAALAELHRGGGPTHDQLAAIQRLTAVAQQSHATATDAPDTGATAPVTATPVRPGRYSSLDGAYQEPGVGAVIGGFDPALVTAINPDDPIGSHTVIGRGKVAPERGPVEVTLPRPVEFTTVNEWLAEYRDVVGLSQSDFGGVAVNKSVVSLIESGGTNPTRNTLLKLVEANRIPDRLAREALIHFYDGEGLAQFDPDYEFRPHPRDYDPADPHAANKWLADLRHYLGRARSEFGGEVAPTTIGRIELETGNVTPGVVREVCIANGIPASLARAALLRFFDGAGLAWFDPQGTRRPHPAEFDIEDPYAANKWLAALRRYLGKTLEDFAGPITPSLVKHFEHERRNPRAATLRDLCAANDIPDEFVRSALRSFCDGEGLAHYDPGGEYLPRPTAIDPAEPFAVNKWLAALRRYLGVTQQEFAGPFSNVTIRAAESFRSNPTAATVRDLCAANGIADDIAREAIVWLFDREGLAWYDPEGIHPPEPTAYSTANEWLRSWRRYLGRSQVEFSGRLSAGAVKHAERGRTVRPRLSSLRMLRDANGIPNHLVVAAIERFYRHEGVEEAEPEEQELFWRFHATRVGSADEKVLRDQIFARYAWVADAVARKMGRSTDDSHMRDELAQVCRISIMAAIANHAPTGEFTPHAWAAAVQGTLSVRYEAAYPGLNRSERELVVGVRRELGIQASALQVDENRVQSPALAESLGIPVTDVDWARQIINGGTPSLDRELVDNGSTLGELIGDDTAQTPFDIVELRQDLQNALAGVADAGAVWNLVQLHLIDGDPLDEAAAHVGFSRATAEELLARVSVALPDMLLAAATGDRGPATVEPVQHAPDERLLERTWLGRYFDRAQRELAASAAVHAPLREAAVVPVGETPGAALRRFEAAAATARDAGVPVAHLVSFSRAVENYAAACRQIDRGDVTAARAMRAALHRATRQDHDADTVVRTAVARRTDCVGRVALLVNDYYRATADIAQAMAVPEDTLDDGAPGPVLSWLARGHCEDFGDGRDGLQAIAARLVDRGRGAGMIVEEVYADGRSGHALFAVNDHGTIWLFDPDLPEVAPVQWHPDRLTVSDDVAYYRGIELNASGAATNRIKTEPDEHDTGGSGVRRGESVTLYGRERSIRSIAEDRTDSPGSAEDHPSGMGSGLLTPGEAQIVRLVAGLAKGTHRSPARSLAALLGLTPEQANRMLLQLHSKIEGVTDARVVSGTGRGRSSERLRLLPAQVEIAALLAGELPGGAPEDTTVLSPDTLQAFRAQVENRAGAALRSPEAEVLRLFMLGHSAKTAAAHLDLSTKTIERRFARAEQELGTIGVIPTVLAAVHAGVLADDGEPRGTVELSEVEERVLRAVADGWSNEEVSTRLEMGHWHRRRLMAELYEEFDVDNKLDLALAAQRQGLFGHTRPTFAHFGTDAPSDGPVRQGERPLSVNQRAVLDGVVQGLTNAEIADRLTISEGAVKAQVKRIYDRLGITDREQLVGADSALVAGQAGLADTRRLSTVELAVFRLIVQGMTNPVIAQRLDIPGSTVTSYVKRVYDKLGVTERDSLVGNVGAFLAEMVQRATSPLSVRQLTVLRLIAQGRTNAEIAGLFHVGEETIKTYVRRIRQKLDMAQRDDLVAVSVRGSGPNTDTDTTAATSEISDHQFLGLRRGLVLSYLVGNRMVAPDSAEALDHATDGELVDRILEHHADSELVDTALALASADKPTLFRAAVGLDSVQRQRVNRAVASVRAGRRPDALKLSAVNKLAEETAGLLFPVPIAVASDDDLSTPELDVLELLAESRTDSEIATSLDTTEDAVKRHVSSILQKLDAVDRTSAVVRALRGRILRLEDLPESDPSRARPLSDQEDRVLVLLAVHDTYEDIATATGLSVSAVSAAVQNIVRAFGARNQTEALVRALHVRYLQLDEIPMTGAVATRELSRTELAALARVAAGEPADGVGEIVRALGAGSRTEAVVRALRMSLLDLDGVPLSDQPLRLSPRETEILPLVALGWANGAIAESLGVSAETVKSTLALLFRKLGVGDRTAAVLEALRRGALDLDDIPFGAQHTTGTPRTRTGSKHPGAGATAGIPGPVTGFDGAGAVDAFGNRNRRGTRATHTDNITAVVIDGPTRVGGSVRSGGTDTDSSSSRASAAATSQATPWSATTAPDDSRSSNPVSDPRLAASPWKAPHTGVSRAEGSASLAGTPQNPALRNAAQRNEICARRLVRVLRALGDAPGLDLDENDPAWHAADNWRILEDTIGADLVDVNSLPVTEYPAHPDDPGDPLARVAATLRASGKDGDSAVVVAGDHGHLFTLIAGQLYVHDTRIDDPTGAVPRMRLYHKDYWQPSYTRETVDQGQAFVAFLTDRGGTIAARDPRDPDHESAPHPQGMIAGNPAEYGGAEAAPEPAGPAAGAPAPTPWSGGRSRSRSDEQPQAVAEGLIRDVLGRHGIDSLESLLKPVPGAERVSDARRREQVVAELIEEAARRGVHDELQARYPSLFGVIREPGHNLQQLRLEFQVAGAGHHSSRAEFEAAGRLIGGIRAFEAALTTAHRYRSAARVKFADLNRELGFPVAGPDAVQQLRDRLAAVGGTDPRQAAGLRKLIELAENHARRQQRFGRLDLHATGLDALAAEYRAAKNELAQYTARRDELSGETGSQRPLPGSADRGPATAKRSGEVPGRGEEAQARRAEQFDAAAAAIDTRTAAFRELEQRLLAGLAEASRIATGTGAELPEAPAGTTDGIRVARKGAPDRVVTTIADAEGMAGYQRPHALEGLDDQCGRAALAANAARTGRDAGEIEPAVPGEGTLSSYIEARTERPGRPVKAHEVRTMRAAFDELHSWATAAESRQPGAGHGKSIFVLTAGTEGLGHMVELVSVVDNGTIRIDCWDAGHDSIRQNFRPADEPAGRKMIALWVDEHGFSVDPPEELVPRPVERDEDIAVATSDTGDAAARARGR
ncbi:LuxR C-terminal-related transcriptional regulator [Nocardia rhamnosiphila]|uniref:LuxR C-terminal-related transcriptional regulator n=1 Tax=Nocardia rhamnosiphila TaxID=426716 RepID=UPI0033E63D12